MIQQAIQKLVAGQDLTRAEAAEVMTEIADGAATRAQGAALLIGARVILAGGLRPDNVKEAIRAVRPYAVDVASGVESAPGIKDRMLLSRFIAATKEA